MTEHRFDRIERKLDCIERKLDLVVEVKTSIGWLKWIVGGAWAAIAGLFLSK